MQSNFRQNWSIKTKNRAKRLRFISLINDLESLS